MALTDRLLRLFQSSPDSTPGAPARSNRERSHLHYDTPIWKAIEYVAGTIGEAQVKNHPKSCHAIRQNARAGKMLIRGRKQTGASGGTPTFAPSYTDIPPSYWTKSIFAPHVTDSEREDDDHTWPETMTAWGPKGIDEPNRYAGLKVSMEEVRRLWPS